MFRSWRLKETSLKLIKFLQSFSGKISAESYFYPRTSLNRRCVAVEYDDDTGLFRACLDATYASTGAEKYLNVTYKLFRKNEGYGKCTYSLLSAIFVF